MQFSFHGAAMVALPSGALFWPLAGVLCVADLHLGKSERMARRGVALLPPYEGTVTLAKLQTDLAQTGAGVVVCLGDSFDDLAAGAALDRASRESLVAMAKGRRWVWVAGNHDAGPLAGGLGGEAAQEWVHQGIVFRHIAAMMGQDSSAAAEVSGHYHPKARLAGQSWPAFWLGAGRLILPAYGAYTGGLLPADAPIAPWLGPQALALVCHAGRVLPRPMVAQAPPHRSGAQRRSMY